MDVALSGMVMEVKAVQWENAKLPMDVTLSEIAMEARESQL